MLMKKYALGKLSFKTFLPPKKETLYSLSSYSSTLPPGNHQSAFCSSMDDFPILDANIPHFIVLCFTALHR